MPQFTHAGWAPTRMVSLIPNAQMRTSKKEKGGERVVAKDTYR